MNTFNYYFRYWWLMSRNAFASVLSQKVSFVIFLLGKTIRFAFFTAFIVFLLRGTNTLAGYSLNETLIFFLTFNLIDVFSQFLYREVYRFRPQVVSGEFDLTLSKPTSALFRSLLGGADVIDLVTIPPLIIAIIVVGWKLDPSWWQVGAYLLLLINGFLIASAFYISALALGIITLEIDYVIWMYRDLVNLGRFPISIYKEPLKGILTYIIPVAIMVTIPAQALIGLVSLKIGILSIVFGLFVLFISLRFWKFALRYYTSASS